MKMECLVYVLKTLSSLKLLTLKYGLDFSFYDAYNDWDYCMT